MRASEDPVHPTDGTTQPQPLGDVRHHDVRRDEPVGDGVRTETPRQDTVPVQREDVRREDVRHDIRRDEVGHEDVRHDGVAAGAVAGGTAAAVGMSRQEVVAREKQRFGGMRFGTAFFGWLTATGLAVLLTALVAGVGAAIGFGSDASVDEVAADAAEASSTIGLVSAIVVLVVLFVAYLAGGYVAGRMARFSGAKQGVAVWLWALVVAVILAIVSAIAGSRWNVLANLDAFPSLPVGDGALTTLGIVTAVLALVVSLVGAVLGGLAGMRFHRRVDREGLGR